MDNIGLMSETVNFIQGSKRNYDSSTMQGGVYFSKDSKEVFLNGESYGNAVPADEGFEYYDTTLNKKILWNGSEWVNMDGISLDTPTNEWTTIE